MARFRELGLTWTLIWTVFLTCFGSSFLVGYNLAVVNLPAKFIQSFVNETILQGGSDSADSAFLYALVSTIFVIAAMIGAGSCGFVADAVGRRNGLLINHLFAIIGAGLVIPCVYAKSAALLYVGRFFIGVNCGITIGVASLYLTEIAPRELRGAIGACNQLAITLGILFAYICTMDRTLNTETLWPVACGLGACFAAVSLVLLPFCPESPRFLFVKKSNEAAARKAFIAFNSKADVDTFLGELNQETEVAKNQAKFNFFQLFKQKDLRMAVLIACLVQVLQQFSGINAVISYSSRMLNLAGVPDEYNQFCVIAIGLLNVIMTIISLPLLERAGRRTLLLWPTVALALSLLFLTITVNLATSLEDQKIAQIMGIISALLILVYICGFALGLGPVPALIVSEIFRQGPRAAAYSLSQFIQWLCNLIVLLSYPNISVVIKGYSFLPFLVCVVFLWFFLYFYVPETKNRTFEEVVRDLTFANVMVGKRTATLGDRTMTVFTKDQHNASNNEVTSRPLLHNTSKPIDPVTIA